MSDKEPTFSSLRKRKGGPNYKSNFQNKNVKKTKVQANLSKWTMSQKAILKFFIVSVLIIYCIYIIETKCVFIIKYININKESSLLFMNTIIYNILAARTIITSILPKFSMKEPSLNEYRQKILSHLIVIADQPTQKYNVAVGFGSCVDIFTDAIPLFERMKFSAPKYEPIHYSVIKNELELTSAFSYFFKQGAASERYVSDSNLFNSLVKNVDKKAKYALGGNAPVMANRFAKEASVSGSKIILAAQHSHEFTNWMNKSVIFTGPETKVADRHLILEYKKDEKFGHLSTSRANRFIIHSDTYNPYLTGIDENFEKKFIEFQPDLFVISGLQMMDNFPFSKNERTQLIKKISKFCSDHRSTKTHFELASFVDEDLVKELITEVIPFSDSIGCNEQELPNIYAALSNKKLITISDSMPKVAQILDILRETFQLLQKVKSSRTTSRIHVHTLAYQAIIQKDDEQTNKMWPNIEQAAAKASVTAIRHICQRNDVTHKIAKILLDKSFRTSAHILKKVGMPLRIHLSEDEPVVCWKEENIISGKVQICLAIGLVCTEVKQTAGGGDNISASALAAQLP